MIAVGVGVVGLRNGFMPQEKVGEFSPRMRFESQLFYGPTGLMFVHTERYRVSSWWLVGPSNITCWSFK